MKDSAILPIDAQSMSDIDFRPLLTLEQARAAESNRSLVIGRRVTLLALSKDRDELVDCVRKIGAESFSAWLDQIEEFQKELKCLQDLASSAHSRLLVAGRIVIEQAPKS